MLTKNIEFKNFIKSKKYKSTERFLINIKKKIFEKSDPFLFSLTSKYKNLFNLMTLIFSLGFLKIYFLGSPLADSQLSWAGVEKVWWNDLRIAHGLLYLLFSIFYFLDYKKSWYFLLADVLIGLFSFLNHHFNS